MSEKRFKVGHALHPSPGFRSHMHLWRAASQQVNQGSIEGHDGVSQVHPGFFGAFSRLQGKEVMGEGGIKGLGEVVCSVKERSGDSLLAPAVPTDARAVPRRVLGEGGMASMVASSPAALAPAGQAQSTQACGSAAAFSPHWRSPPTPRLLAESGGLLSHCLGFLPGQPST